MIISDALSTRAEDLARRVDLMVSPGTNAVIDELTLGDFDLLGQSANLLRHEFEVARAADPQTPVSEIVHALRNPLAAIIGYSEMLIDEAEGEMRDELTEILASAHDLLEAISQAIPSE